MGGRSYGWQRKSIATRVLYAGNSGTHISIPTSCCAFPLLWISTFLLTIPTIYLKTKQIKTSCKNCHKTMQFLQCYPIVGKEKKNNFTFKTKK
ncbi:MAG: LITAF-like zinc ribbon domain-containing protein [Tannerellaceae bacterium]|nr:LITAF-like zinc ribbon domain-containing protein [Tannerellaceae bacterium]